MSRTAGLRAVAQRGATRQLSCRKSHQTRRIPMSVDRNKVVRMAFAGAFRLLALALLMTTLGAGACSSSMRTSSESQAVSVAAVNAYVANENSTTVSVIDTATNTITATIPVGRNPASV